MANKQNPFLSALWPVIMVVVALIIGIKYHATVLAWIVGGVIWTAGAVYLIGQYKEDAETLAPHVICAIGALTLCIWAASA